MGDSFSGWDCVITHLLQMLGDLSTPPPPSLLQALLILLNGAPNIWGQILSRPNHWTPQRPKAARMRSWFNFNMPLSLSLLKIMIYFAEFYFLLPNFQALWGLNFIYSFSPLFPVLNYCSRAEVPKLGSPDVLGLQLPEADQDFWES